MPDLHGRHIFLRAVHLPRLTPDIAAPHPTPLPPGLLMVLANTVTSTCVPLPELNSSFNCSAYDAALNRRSVRCYEPPRGSVCRRSAEPLTCAVSQAGARRDRTRESRKLTNRPGSAGSFSEALLPTGRQGGSNSAVGSI